MWDSSRNNEPCNSFNIIDWSPQTATQCSDAGFHALSKNKQLSHTVADLPTGKASSPTIHKGFHKQNFAANGLAADKQNKRLCYCRGTARRATPVEILWPFFLTELLTRSSANPEEPCEHTVSWKRVNCCTNVRRIACENVCNRWMTFEVIQGHCRCHHLIGHILFPISLPL